VLNFRILCSVNEISNLDNLIISWLEAKIRKIIEKQSIWQISNLDYSSQNVDQADNSRFNHWLNHVEKKIQYFAQLES